MKTPVMPSTNFVKTAIWTIVIACVVIALFIFYLASTGDTTVLGDPYYEDQILAPERAFAPWAFSLICVVCSILAGGVMAWSRRKN